MREAILQSFYALRETMLEELDLDEPAHPLLISGGRRLKVSGAAGVPDRARKSSSSDATMTVCAEADVDALLARALRPEEA